MVRRWTLSCIAALLSVMAACGGGGEQVVVDAATDAEPEADAPRSDNTSLSALTVTRGALEPPFEPGIAEYVLQLPLEADDVAFTPSAAVPSNVTIAIDGEAVASGATSTALPLSPGGRDVDIVVTATSGAAQTYRVRVRRGVPGIELSFDGAPLSSRLVPAYDPDIEAYTLDVGLWLQRLQVTVIPELAGSTITINATSAAAAVASAPLPLNLGATPITVVVTPPVGPARTYAIDVSRALPTHRSYIKASNPGTEPTAYGDAFGFTVALSEDTLVVGAPLEASSATGVGGNQADNSAYSSGAVYVFVRSGGTWVQQAYLKASNSQANDGFGRTVALSGDTLVVGAPFESSGATEVGGEQGDNGSSESGATYVFTRSGGTWTQQAYLKASNTDAFDWFGISVAIDGDTVAVTAGRESSAAVGVDGDQADDSAPNSGAVYVFTRAGTTWSQQAYLKASNAAADDQFGSSISLWGDTLVAGATGEDSAAVGVGGDQSDNSAPFSGAVYVFHRSGTNWSQQAYLKASNTDAGDLFGAVALWHDTLVVGAGGEDSAARGVGGDQADDTATNAGAAYVFQRAGVTWAQDAYLKAIDQEAGDTLGGVVAIWGDMVVVGASREASPATGVDPSWTDNSQSESGAAFTFARSDGYWTNGIYPGFPSLVTYGLAMKSSNTGAGDRFGYDVAVWGDTVAVGAIGEDGSSPGIDGDQSSNGTADSGAVYVLR